MRLKSSLSCIGSILMMGALSGCVTNLFPGGPGVAGGLVTSVRGPAQMLSVAIDPTSKCVKEGSSSAGAFLGIFAFGDSSITAAMKNGDITRVHHIDHEVSMFLFGLWASDKLIVCGE